jgi:hypothetical protein
MPTESYDAVYERVDSINNDDENEFLQIPIVAAASAKRELERVKLFS